MAPSRFQHLPSQKKQKSHQGISLQISRRQFSEERQRLLRLQQSQRRARTSQKNQKVSNVGEKKRKKRIVTAVPWKRAMTNEAATSTFSPPVHPSLPHKRVRRRLLLRLGSQRHKIADGRQLIESCMKKYGRTDVLVNDIDMSPKGAPASMDQETWDKQVNQFGICLSHVLPCFADYGEVWQGLYRSRLLRK
jgi:hypothetical protein